LVDWCLDMNLNPYFLDVSHPDFYTPSNLPQSAKNLINKKFDIYLYKQELPSFILESIKGSLNNMNSKEYDMDLWFMFKKKNGILDSNRKQSFTNTFQELNSVI